MDRLKVAREAKGWNKAELARRSGVSESTIGRYERGIQSPTVDTARDLADALDVSLEWLTGEEKAAV